MARLKFTEFRAKSLLIDGYQGHELREATLKADIAKLDAKQKYIVKVDEGIKKRGKQGLVRLNIARRDMAKAVDELAERGYYRFIAEPMLAHADDEEHYVSIERIRNGFQVLYSKQGGVNVEEHPETITKYIDLKDVPLPKGFLNHLTDVMNREHMSFLEINPLVVRGEDCFILDAAVLVDGAGDWKATWNEDDIVDARQKTVSEETITQLNNNSPASFSFRVLNPNGSIWLLLSGGGASITIADEAANRNKAELIGNYGEYSGGPTREETQIYTDTVLQQALQSTAPRKAIVLAGGVANFTDVKKTFAGVIDALTKHIDALKAAEVKVYVRRGGPKEKEGLALMKDFLIKHGIYGSIHGSDTVLTTVVDEALEYVDA
jgi:succinyl-CoA synthetase beta subunit